MSNPVNGLYNRQMRSLSLLTTSRTGCPHERPTPCQAELSHLNAHFVFQTFHSKPNTLLCPEKCKGKLFFAASGNTKQAGKEGCV